MYSLTQASAGKNHPRMTVQSFHGDGMAISC